MRRAATFRANSAYADKIHTPDAVYIPARTYLRGVRRWGYHLAYIISSGIAPQDSLLVVQRGYEAEGGDRRRFLMDRNHYKRTRK